MPMKLVDPDPRFALTRRLPGDNGDTKIIVFWRYKDMDYSRPLDYHVGCIDFEEDYSIDVRDLQAWTGDDRPDAVKNTLEKALDDADPVLLAHLLDCARDEPETEEFVDGFYRVRISETYEVVTPESAELGCAEESGFVREDEELGLAELVSAVNTLLETVGPANRSSDPCSKSAYDWVSFTDETGDLRTGRHESRALHVSAQARDDRNARLFWAAVDAALSR